MVDIAQLKAQQCHALECTCVPVRRPLATAERLFRAGDAIRRDRLTELAPNGNRIYPGVVHSKSSASVIVAGRHVGIASFISMKIFTPAALAWSGNPTRDTMKIYERVY